MKELNINLKERNEFINTIYSNSKKDEELKLKLLYFNLNDEFHYLDKEKKRIEHTIKRKINYRLLLLLSLLIGQTAFFYHMIFNIDYLGWDVVEPLTFLIGSVVFVGGLFLYVKMNKKYNNVEGIVKDLTSNYQKKKYLKFNFNEKRYNELKIYIEDLKIKLDNKSFKC